MLRVVEADPGIGLQQARQLFQEYAGSLETDLEFQNFGEELATLPGKLRSTSGSLAAGARGHGAGWVCCSPAAIGRHLRDETPVCPSGFSKLGSGPALN